MQASVEDALVRVLKEDGQSRAAAGAGWLLQPHRLITCAHVVNLALGDGRAWDHPTQPAADAVIRFDLPNREAVGADGPPPHRARVLSWHPPNPSAPPRTPTDIAVLELLDGDQIALLQPPCTLALTADQAASIAGRAYGYPAGGGKGLIRSATITGSNAGLLQATPEPGQTIGAGFSGGPFTDADGCILGMTALHNPSHQVARLIPVDTLELACPELAGLRRGARPTVTLRLHAEGETLVIVGAAACRRQPLPDLQQRIKAGDLTALHGCLFENGADRDAQLRPPPAASADSTRILRLICADADSAGLPWHCLECDPGKPLAAQGWTIECVAEAEPQPHPHNLAQVLILAPDSAELAPDAPAHIARMEQAFRALLPKNRAAVDKAHDRADLLASLRHDPELVYVYARADRNGNLVLGRGAGGAQALAPLDLLAELGRLAIKPLVWIHCLEDGANRIEPSQTLAGGRAFPLIWLQRTQLRGAADGQARARDQVQALAKLATPAPAAALGELHHSSFVGWQARPGLVLTSPKHPDALLKAQIRAALIRLRLGRKQQRNQIAQETQQALDGDILLFAVGGEHDARPADLPEQVRYDLENQGDPRAPVRVVKLTLPLLLDAELVPEQPDQEQPQQLLEDSIWIALERDLRLGALSARDALMQVEPDASPNEQLIVLLAWKLDAAPALTADGLERWIGAWARVLAQAFPPDQIPARARLLAGACIQWPKGWPSQAGLTLRDIPGRLRRVLRGALRDFGHGHLKVIHFLDCLDLLTEDDLYQFFVEFDRLEDSCTRGCDLDALVAWTLDPVAAGGRFEDTVTRIYQGCRARFENVPGARPNAQSGTGPGRTSA